MGTISLIILMLVNIWSTDVVTQPPASSPKLAGQGRNICDSTDYSIDYIKSGQKESVFTRESNDRIWLKLTNKSQKTLKFKIPFTQENAKFLKGASKELDIYYEVVEKETCDSEDKGVDELPIGYKRVEVYFEIDLKPRRSFIFSAAKQYFLPKHAIYVSYECARGCSKEEKDKMYKAYYFASELPAM